MVDISATFVKKILIDMPEFHKNTDDNIAINTCINPIEEYHNPDIKQVHVNMDVLTHSQKRKKEPKQSKEPKQLKERVIVADWMFTDEQLTYTYQYELIQQLYTSITTNTKEVIPELAFISSQINAKKNGYKQQDIEKGQYCADKFVLYTDIVNLLYKSKLLCYYCSEPVNIIYKYVREPKQWSLERIFNDRGHNTENVKIACLSCNLRRKTMHYQRYIDTKKMAKIVKIDVQPEYTETETETANSS